MRRGGPESRGVRVGMGIGTILVLAFLFIPILVIMLYAFNTSVAQTWPIPGFSTKWFSVAWHNPEVRSALWMSVKAGLGATAIALTLGSLAAFAIHRFHFFGREAVSFLLVLPLALPGIVTGMALNAAINFGGTIFGLSFLGGAATEMDLGDLFKSFP